VAQDILGAGRHLQQLVSDALDVSRLRLGKMELSLDIVSVVAVVEQAVAMTAAVAAEKNIRFSHTVPLELAVIADERRLTQVLYNLLQNAVRFSPEGARVSVSAERDSDSVRLSVADTGHGIPPEEQERIFEPFAAMDREGQSCGSGLGLSVSRGLVELMGGTLDLASTPGAGSTFSFTLPAALPQ
jgi:signal transduction histidine kinase